MGEVMETMRCRACGNPTFKDGRSQYCDACKAEDPNPAKTRWKKNLVERRKAVKSGVAFGSNAGKPPSAVQGRVLGVFERFHAEGKEPPTFSEVQAALGFKRIGSVAQAILPLVEKGYLRRVAGDDDKGKKLARKYVLVRTAKGEPVKGGS